MTHPTRPPSTKTRSVATGWRVVAGLVLATLFVAPSASAQSPPWDTFTDSLSDSVCDVIKAGNVELVVLTSTAQLVIVTGTDVTLADTFVDVDGNVFLGNDSVGFITFAEDGDGFRTLWWVSLAGRVVNVDGFTGVPTETDQFPSDFTDVPCDACPLWDDPNACLAPGDVLPPVDVPDVPSIVDVPPIVVGLCGSNITVGMIGTMMGLLGMGFMRRRGV